MTISDKDFVLAILSDRREHRLSEILRRSLLERGHGLTVHSRVSELRTKHGFNIACWTLKGQRDSVYQLIASPLESATTGVVPQAKSAVADSSGAEASRDVASAGLRAGHVDETVESVAPLDSQPTLFPTAPGAYDREAA